MSNYFIELIFLSTFFFTICISKKILLYFNVTPLIGEILTGIILGPNLLNIVPYPETFKFLGYLGMLLLMIESGLDFDITKIKNIWKDSLIIAVSGSILPFLFGLLFIYLFNYPNNIIGFLIASFSLAPTSIGMSIKVLEENKKIDSAIGQSIISTAIIDDVISMIILGVLVKCTETPNDITMIVLSVFLPIVFTLITGILGVQVIPKCIKKSLNCIDNTEKIHFEKNDQVVGLELFILSFAYSVIGYYIGSPFLGVFMAGFTFSNIDNTHKIWKHQVKRIAKWLITFFFSATIGFSIPIKSMLNSSAIWKSLILIIFSGLFSKLITPYFVLKENKFTTGIALVSRGEIAFLMADYGFNKNLFNEELYSILMWVFLVCSIISPFIFNKLLKKKMINLDNINNENENIDITISGNYHHQMISDITDALEDMSYEVKSTLMRKNGLKSIEILKIKNKSGAVLDKDEIKSHIIKALGDPDENIEITSSEETMQIELKGNHHKHILHEICKKLDDLDVELDDLHVDHIKENNIKKDVIIITIKNNNINKNQLKDNLIGLYKSYNIEGDVDIIV